MPAKPSAISKTVVAPARATQALKRKNPQPRSASANYPVRGQKRAAVPSSPGASATGKIARVVVLLRRPQGVSLPALMAETGWQAHSVRGAIAGAIKKKLGLAIISKRVDGIRIYWIEHGR